jgi:pimeloyl-ACP methyl ester carboxylesterase
MTETQEWTEAFVTIADPKIQLLQGGSGPPLLCLHGAGGNPGWLGYHRGLAEQSSVDAPSHPGFNASERSSWLDTVTDMAHFYLEFIDTFRLRPLALLGSSMGDWIAAEVAARCPQQLKALVLVDAVGIKPQVGEIAEVLMTSREEAQKLRFYDASQVPEYAAVVTPEPTLAAQETLFRNQEMASRLCWRPYMHNLKLPAYLRRVKTPTMIIWGRQDAIVPLNCNEGPMLHKDVLRSIELLGREVIPALKAE